MIFVTTVIMINQGSFYNLVLYFNFRRSTRHQKGHHVQKHCLLIGELLTNNKTLLQ